jgi:hypothetical protein
VGDWGVGVGDWVGVGEEQLSIVNWQLFIVNEIEGVSGKVKLGISCVGAAMVKVGGGGAAVWMEMTVWVGVLVDGGEVEAAVGRQATIPKSKIQNPKSKTLLARRPYW